jgi:hypothetical protein
MLIQLRNTSTCHDPETVSCCAGVTPNGQINATPVEIVRVWLGKYDAGQAVIANYATAAIQFDLTYVFSGTATLNDDLSGWSGTSSNASKPRSRATLAADVEGGMEIAPLFSGWVAHHKPTAAAAVWAIDPVIVDVIAAFTIPLSIAAATYLTKQLINRFATDLKPTNITLSKKSNDYSLEVKFSTPGDTLRANGGSDRYEAAVNNALAAAKNDPKSDLAAETWTLSETRLTFGYDV